MENNSGKEIEQPFAYSLQEIAKEFLITNEDSPEDRNRKKSFHFPSEEIFVPKRPREDFLEWASRYHQWRDPLSIGMLLKLNIEGGKALSELNKLGIDDKATRLLLYDFMQGYLSASRRNRAQMSIYSKTLSPEILVLSDEATRAWESLQNKLLHRAQPSTLSKK